MRGGIKLFCASLEACRRFHLTDAIMKNRTVLFLAAILPGPSALNAQPSGRLSPLRRASKRLLLASVLSLFPLAIDLQAQVTRWTGAVDNDWFKPGNWNNGVPTSTTNFFISNGGTSQITTGGAAVGNSPSVGTNNGAGTLEILNGSLSVSSISFGLSPGGGNGTLLLSGSNATLSVATRIDIGASGIGVATIENGGVLTSPNLTLIASSSGTGTLKINGTAWARGTVEAAQIAEGPGNGQIIFDGGVLRALADKSDFLQNFEPGDVTINSGGAFIDSNGFNIGISTALTGNGSLHKTGSGTLTLTGNNSYGGSTVVRDGTLVLGTGGVIKLPSDLSVAVMPGDTATFKLDGGTLSTGYLFAASNLGSTGTINVTGGNWTNTDYFQIGSGGNGTLNLSSGNVTSGVVVIGSFAGSNGVANVSGGNLTTPSELSVGYDGTGTLNLSGGVVSTPTTTVGRGTAAVGALNLTGGVLTTGQLQESAGSGTVTFDGGTVRLTGNQTGFLSGFETGDVQLAGSGGTIDTQGFAVSTALSLTGNGSLTKLGNGRLTLTGNSSYTGATAISAGTVALSGGGQIFDSSSVDVASGATLDVSGNSRSYINNLSGAGNVTLGESGSLRVTNSTNTTFSGAITGIGNFEKSGNSTLSVTGSLFLSGNSRDYGRLDINGGTLSLDSGTLTVRSKGEVYVNNGLLSVNGSSQVSSSFIAVESPNGGVQVNGGNVNTYFMLLSGNLEITGGTTEIYSGSYIGSGHSSSKDGTVKASGGAWDAGGLEIGSSGNGTVEISGNASVTADYVRLGTRSSATGTLKLLGGTLTTRELSKSSGNGTVTFNGGTLRLSGDQANLFGGFEDGDVTLVSAGATIDTQGYAVSTAVGLTGNGSLTKQGTGSLTLTGNNSYTGNTTVNNGTLTVSSGGTINLANSTLFVGRDAGDNATFVVSGGDVNSSTVHIGSNAGSTGLATVSDGTWTSKALYVGNNGTGTLNLSGGTISVNGTSTLGRYAGATGTANVTGGNWTSSANLLVGFDGDGVLNLSGGSVTNAFGAVGTTASEATVNMSGGTWANKLALYVGDIGIGILNLTGGTVSVGAVGNGTLTLGSQAAGNGTLNIGTFGGNSTAGTLNAAIVTGGNGAARVNFNQVSDITFDPAITGKVSVNQLGLGTTTLTANSTYKGATTVASGALYINGDNSLATGNVTVTGGTLGGSGIIGGNVTVMDGGHIAPGTSPGTLTVAGLNLSSGSILDYELGAPNVVGSGVNDLIQVNGDLTLAGVLNLTNVGGFDSGVYRLMNYTGNLTNNGLVFGTLPTGLWDLTVDTTTANEVNLLVAAATQQYWDGANTTPNGVVDGGTGTWNATATNWTNSGGNVNNAWAGTLGAVFAGTAGNVTIADGFTATAKGFAFDVGGYTLSAEGSGKVNISGNTEFSTTTGDTTITASITGSNGNLVKSGNGTLVLTGDNSYANGTTVREGTLTLRDGGAITTPGTATVVALDAGDSATLNLAANSTITTGYVLVGTKSGATGTVNILGGNWTTSSDFQVGYQGNGTLNLADGTLDDTDGSIARFSGSTGVANVTGGNWTSTRYLVIGHAGTGTLNLSGGAVTSGTTQLGIDGTGSGALNLTGGVLTTGQVSRGTGNATVAFDGGKLRLSADQSDLFSGFTDGAVTFTGSGAVIDTQDFTVATSAGITGNGSLTKLGSGTLALTGSTTYAGGTVVNSGTLGIRDGGAISHASANLTVAQVNGDSAAFALGTNSTLKAYRGFLGYDGGANGTFQATGGDANFADELYVGYTGNGSLVLSGGNVSNTKAFIGVNSPSVSSANITGGTWTSSGELTVGYGGRGSLAISGNGSVVSAGAFFGYLAASGNNSATITGTGASWTSTSAFYLGNDGSNNTIAISGGGALRSGNADFLIGANAGTANNSLTLTGSGSTFANNGTLYVGRSGTGNSMTIADGAAATSRNVRIGGGTGSNGTTSDNFVTIDGAGSTWTIGGTLRVGSSGSNSSLSIRNGGSVAATGNSFIGYDPSSTGNVLSVSGTGSTFTGGNLVVGLGGGGTLEISNNASVMNNLATIGQSAGSTASAHVTGGNWTNSSELYVGMKGNATLLISGGNVSSFRGFIGTEGGSTGVAKISAGSWTTSDSLDVGVLGAGTLDLSGSGSVNSGNSYIASQSSGTGLVKVSGGNWTNEGLVVGARGNGTMEISGNGSVSSTDGDIGSMTGSNGLVEVTGGDWSITRGLQIGLAGNGTLAVSGNGSVTSNYSIIGTDAGSTGLVNVTGGNWTSTTDLFVGRRSSGTLNISGGNVSAGSIGVASFASATGNLTLSGGVLATGQIAKGAGSGTVTLQGGTLRLTGNQGALFDGFNPGDVSLSGAGATIDTLGYSIASAASLSGSGSLLKLGTGTLALSGNSSFAGGTTLREGTLQTGSPTALGNGPLTVEAGTFDPVGPLTLSSLTWKGGTFATGLGTTTDLVSASGSLTLSPGTKTFVFSDAGGFTPNTAYTILSAANLTPAFLSSFTGNALLGVNPVFSINGNDLVVNFQGSSSGSILQNVQGPWTPTNAEFLVNGAVRTGNATSSNRVYSLNFLPGSSLTVFNNLTVTSGNFTTNADHAGLTGGTVLTPGTFNKLGGGNLTAASNFFVGGAANILEGGFFVNGQFVSRGRLTVFQNALLGGNGTITGDLFNSGTVNPGNSPGTLSVTGNYVQYPSGTLVLEIASHTVFDRLLVGGTASLAGRLDARNLGPQLAYGQRYAFLQAGAISGRFNQITMPQPSIFRGRFLAQGGTGSLVVAPASYTLVAKTQNQKNVAKALNSFIPATSGDRQTVSTALDLLSAGQYPTAFDQISPAIYQSFTALTIGQAFAQTQMINQRQSSVRLGAKGFQAAGFQEQPIKYDADGKSVADAKSLKSVIRVPDQDNWSAWAMGTGIFSNTGGLASVPNFHSQAGGFLAGADYTFGDAESGAPSLTLGGYGGYSYTYADYSGGSTTEINSALFGLYATYARGGFYADTVLGGGYNAYQTKRSISFSTIDRTARSTPDGGQLSAAINIGYDWNAAGFTFGPIAGLQYTYAGIGSFGETGANSLDLNVDQQNASSLRTTLGGRVAYTWNLSKSICLIPEVRLFWQHEFLGNTPSLGASFANGADFTLAADSTAPDSVFAGAGLTAQFGKNWNAFFFYNANFGNQQSVTNSISAGLGWKF